MAAKINEHKPKKSQYPTPLTSTTSLNNKELITWLKEQHFPEITKLRIQMKDTCTCRDILPGRFAIHSANLVYLACLRR